MCIYTSWPSAVTFAMAAPTACLHRVLLIPVYLKCEVRARQASDETSGRRRAGADGKSNAKVWGDGSEVSARRSNEQFQVRAEM